MKYATTRGGSDYTFEQALFEGIAPDGGLFVPSRLPEINDARLRSWKNFSYHEIFLKIVREFIGEDEVPTNVLEGIVHSAWEEFRDSSVIPLRKFHPQENSAFESPFFIAEMFHGPTLSFKVITFSNHQTFSILFSSVIIRFAPNHNFFTILWCNHV
eukprot:TRINITY_DN3051_c0_g1_i2.p1 TRINITY_DN3051_c0_g1~~TRINITY_DN3051_c0_g1_i2.p1  ORF type:complete len:157 (+),score=28.14 TRINITY_DN3051_c0_g1_i2:59-529(+)